MTEVSISLPSERDIQLAGDGSRKLAKQFAGNGELEFELDGDAVVLPKTAVRLLIDLLAQMAEGNTVTMVPVHKEMTTQEAADFLNVSRPYLIKLLKAEKIPFHTVGTHRRIRFEELMKYKSVRDQNNSSAADELSALSQEIGLEF